MMAHGVQARSPFLDRTVADFAFRLPDDLKATVKSDSRLLRDWLKGCTSTPEAGLRKREFALPIGEWIAANKIRLQGLVSAQPGVAEILQPGEVQRLFMAARCNWQSAWSLIFYALWHSHHVMGIPSDGNIEDVLTMSGCLA